MNIEKWLYDELSEAQKTRIKLSFETKLMGEIQNINLISSSLDLGDLAQSVLNRIDYEELAEVIKKNILSGVKSVKLTAEELKPYILENLQPVFDDSIRDIDTEEISKALEKKILGAL